MSKITRYRGDTAADQVIVTDNAGTVLDIGGYVFKLTISTESRPTTSSSMVAQIQGTITSAVGGVVEFAFSTAQSDQIPATYYYDIQMIDSQNRVATLTKDKYEFVQDITK